MSLPMHRRAKLSIGYLLQEASIFCQLTVQNNILLVFEQTRISRQEEHQKLNHLLQVQDFHLEQVANNKGIQLSGSERRLTEVARALAAAPHSSF